MKPQMDPTITRIALITGASRGIGRATALDLAEDGTGVIITYLASPDAARTVVSEIEGRGARAVAFASMSATSPRTTNSRRLSERSSTTGGAEPASTT